MSKKPLRSQARQIVFSTFQRLNEEKSGTETHTAIIKRVSSLTGVSDATIRRVVQEGKSNNGTFTTPGKNRKGGKKKIDLDDFDLNIIRNKIKKFYLVRKEIPTLNKLLAVLHEDTGFNGQKESLRCILKNMGFEYVKCPSHRNILMERQDIVLSRCRYLERLRENQEAGDQKKYVIYLDETYIHTLTNTCWQSQSASGPSKPAGSRWTIVHSGGERGFVPNSCLVYNSKTADNHDKNSTFTKWLTHNMIPNLLEPCIVVIDNARYHSVQINKPPTEANCTADIKTWLKINNISYDDGWRKCKLLELVNKNKTEPQYEIDELIKSKGHEVLRLPPHHCQLNPMEIIWIIMKQKLEEKIALKPGADIKKLVESACTEIDVNQWKECCEKVHQIENMFYEHDKGIEFMQDKFIMNDTADSTSSSDFEEQNMDSD